MAIYSLHHSSIGKASQERPHTAAAHVRYITRARALTCVEGARMPTGQKAAAEFLARGEDHDRANARVIDKVMLALPNELSPEQRVALVRAYAEAVTQGRAPWLAAFHEEGKDTKNPHVHLVIRDRDPDTGKRVAMLSEKGSTERLRLLWEEHANLALSNAHRPERIDRRTLEAQGIERKPTIHEGVRARRARRRGRPLRSRGRHIRNAALARSRSRYVRYPEIDGGGSRAAYNASISGLRPETEQDIWAAYDDEQKAQELAELRGIHNPQNNRVENILQKRKLRRKRKIKR